MIISPTNSPPVLTSLNQQLVVEWPHAPEFHLQGSSDTDTNWTNVPGKPQSTNGWNFLTLDPTNTWTRFRLQN